MAVQLRAAFDAVVSRLIMYGLGDSLEIVQNSTTSDQARLRPTWHDIGQALGVSGQAAHRKYAHLASGRHNEAEPR
jgi:hypothetical protein